MLIYVNKLIKLSNFAFRAVFKFDEGNRLGVTATGKEFPEFKSYFGTDERGFGYIRIKVWDSAASLFTLGLSISCFQ